MEIETLEGPSEFLKIMGDYPRNRILDFLLGNTNYDFTLKEIAKKSKVGYATIKRIWHHFIKTELVKPTRKVGKAVFYKYNNYGGNGKKLRKFYLEIIFNEVEKEVMNEKELMIIRESEKSDNISEEEFLKKQPGLK
ncbi:hypothetical protein JW949_01940 [Candidatus Woesearchaeota archaeon]|nr:hypothetical protein [Candidatus Woesearchaeota archaeon]